MRNATRVHVAARWFAAGASVVACSAPASDPAGRKAASASPPLSVAATSGWREATESPQPAPTPESARVAALGQACGTLDGALVRVAERVLAENIDDVDAVIPLLREAGSPLVRPRIVSGPDIARALASLRKPETRCGVAVGNRELAVVADAVADMEPLPVRSRTGAWLELRAVLNAPARGAHVVLLGARGAPRTVGTTFERGHVRARFALDRPGPFLVQVVADLENGPRPVLEARVFADVAPSHDAGDAPGEKEHSLDEMIASVRADEKLPALRRDSRLDALAQKHVEAMRVASTLAHDVGDGDLRTRFEAEGYAAAVIGENVARAASLRVAHRVLYASPSHRANLVNAQYTHMGLATATLDDGRVLVCEVFASDLR